MAVRRNARNARTTRRTSDPVFTPGWLRILTGLSISSAWFGGTYHAVMGDTLPGIFLAAITPPIVIMGVTWWITAALLNPTSQRSRR